jgi:hypothetical protein
MGSGPSRVGSRHLGRLVAAWCGLAAATIALSGVVPAGAAGKTTPGPPPRLILFVRAPHGGWSAHPLTGVRAGVGAPSVAARGGEVLLAQRSQGGDVTVSAGSIAGAFTSTDLTSTLGAPVAAGRPVVFVGGDGAATVWYRTTTGSLEFATQRAGGAAWMLTDVTAATGSPALAGDPTVLAQGTTEVAYAVTALGGVEEFEPPAVTGVAWSAIDPTQGLVFPQLAGSLVVLHVPGMATATALVAPARSGDVLELSNELAGPPLAVGPWHATDLTALGAPSATGSLAGGGDVPVVTYPTWSGHLVAMTLRSGLDVPGAFTSADLTDASGVIGARDALPSVVAGPGGPEILERSATGDLLLVSASAPTAVVDVSFEPRTAQLTSADAGSTMVGTAVVLVAADGGPVASTPLRRRIVLLAASFDQQHRGYQTSPYDSNCNRFTAAFGRGSTWGCPRGTSSEEWCSDFAEWVWASAGVRTEGITGWSATFVSWGATHHRVQYGTHFRPRPGDAIVWGTRWPLYGTHVGLIVSARGRYLDVVSGNSNGDLPRFGSGVWRWGPFVGSTSTVNGYPVLGIVSP